MVRHLWQWGLLFALLGGGWWQMQAQAQTQTPAAATPGDAAAGAHAAPVAAEEEIPDVSQMSADVLRIMVVQLYHQVHDLEAQVAQLKASAGAAPAAAPDAANVAPGANTSSIAALTTANNGWVVKVNTVASAADPNVIQQQIAVEMQKIGVARDLHTPYYYEGSTGLNLQLIKEQAELNRMQSAKKSVLVTQRRDNNGNSYNQQYKEVNEFTPTQLAAQEQKIRQIKNDIAQSEKKIADLQKQLISQVITGETEDGQAISVQVSGDDVAIVKGLKAGDKVQVRGRIIRLGPPLQVESRTLVVQQ